MTISTSRRTALITVAGLLALALRLLMGAGTTLTLTPIERTSCVDDIYAE